MSEIEENINKIIPKQLQNPQFRFCLVGKEDNPKQAYPTSWNKVNGYNYSFNDIVLLNRFKDGITNFKQNYGVICGLPFGSLIVIDVDNLNLEKFLQNELKNRNIRTFTVRSAGKGFSHYYFYCDDPRAMTVYNFKNEPIDKEKAWADIRGSSKDNTGMQVVGPGSIIPEGRRYEVSDDCDIKFITREEILDIFKDFWNNEELPDIPDKQKIFSNEGSYKKSNPKHGEMIDSIKSLIPLSKMLQEWGSNPSGRKKGTQLPCPIGHQSDSKKNLEFNDSLGLARCYHSGCPLCPQSGGRAGDIFTIKMYRDKISFNEAFEFYRKKCNLPEPKEDDDNNSLNIIRALSKNIETKTQAIRKMYQYLLTKYKFITTAGDEIIYYFEGGIYKDTGESFIKKTIKTIIGEFDSASMVEEIIEHIRRSTIVQEKDVQPPENLIVLNNGIFNTDTYQLEDFNSNYLFLTRMPITYDESKNYIAFDMFLNQIFKGDKLERFKADSKEMFGYTLVRHQKWRKAFLLSGSGANGKSVLLYILEKMLGQDNVSSISLQTLTDINHSRFALAGLYQKNANIYADLSNRSILETGNFKILTGEDTITADRKNQSFLTFMSYAKQIFSCNETPDMKDDSDGFWDRWKFIIFPNKFEGKDRDPELKYKLTEPDMLSGIFNFAIEGLKTLKLNNGFTYNDSPRDIRDMAKRASDPLQSFWDDCVEYCEKGRISKDVFYRVYSDYCKYNNMPIMSSQVLGTRLKDGRGNFRIDDERMGLLGKRVLVWSKIKFIDDIPSSSLLDEKVDYINYSEFLTSIQRQSNKDTILFELYNKKRAQSMSMGEPSLLIDLA